MPISKAMANSCSVSAPRKTEPISSIDNTGSTDVIEVLIERINTWLSDWFIISL